MRAKVSQEEYLKLKKKREEAYAQRVAKGKGKLGKGSGSRSASPSCVTVVDRICRAWRRAGKCPRSGAGRGCPYEHPPVETAAVVGADVPNAFVATTFCDMGSAAKSGVDPTGA